MTRHDIKTILAKKGLDADDKNILTEIDAVTNTDVERALNQPAGIYNFKKLITLISPAAQNYLEQMAQAARDLTVQRFGRTIKLYAPLYLSNYCINSCKYCGFNHKNKFKPSRLTIDQAVAEADIIASEGFRDILLVSGEDRKYINVDYLCQLAKKLRSKFSAISIEIYQLTPAEYAKLFTAGIEGVTLYQETYDRKAYDHYHPAGPKADYDNRLNGPDSIAAAGMRRIGLGALLGLSDWRLQTLALAEHAHYLIKKYWRSQVSFSFPRLRPAYETNEMQFDHLISDADLVQMITALRLCFADAGLVLSTRERADFRDHLMKLGITRLSAGSKTNPGGYSGDSTAVEQFQIDDSRSCLEVADAIKRNGFEPVFKDWDRAFIDD